MEGGPNRRSEQSIAASGVGGLVFFGTTSPLDTDKIQVAIDAGSTVVIAGRAGYAAEPQTKLLVGGLEVDLDARRATYRGRDVRLTEQELRILSALARYPGRALSYDELSIAAWSSNSFGHTDPIRSAIKRLRRKLEIVRADSEIQAARGYGFRLVHGLPTDQRRQASS